MAEMNRAAGRGRAARGAATVPAEAAPLSLAGLSEDERIRLLAQGAGTDAGTADGRSPFRKSFGHGARQHGIRGNAVPAPDYQCHRCGQRGHFIGDCPANSNPALSCIRVKVAIGIPRSTLKLIQPSELEDAYKMGGLMAVEGGFVLATQDECVGRAPPSPSAGPRTERARCDRVAQGGL